MAELVLGHAFDAEYRCIFCDLAYSAFRGQACCARGEGAR